MMTSPLITYCQTSETPVRIRPFHGRFRIRSRQASHPDRQFHRRGRRSDLVEPRRSEGDRRRHQEGVVAVDTAAEGADATVTTNNVQAGEIACQYIVDKLGGKGDVIIENGPQVSAVIDRVVGCKNVLSKNAGIKVLSNDQDAKGSREGGLTVAQGYLTRFQKIDAIFAINDPQAIGTDLAARQQNRSGIIITAVDGAPDIEAALKDPNSPQIQASASQDPFFMARRAVQVGVAILKGSKPASSVELLPSKLVTRDNIGQYQGWTSARSQ
jgi:ribose transport system substrate-binding protein